MTATARNTCRFPDGCRHVCTGTPARARLLIPPHRQPAEQPKHIPPRRWRCSPFPATGRRCKENGTRPNQPQRAHPLERIPTDTSARSPLLIPPAKQQDNRGTPHMKVVPLFPQPAGGAKKTAHVQINPNERTRPNASSQTRLHRHARINGTCAPRTNPNNQTSNHPVGF